MLIIGGGCNGAGVALEASTWGLKVALIDSEDFGGLTSSKSTKLAHGGLRYLEQIIKRDGNIVENYELLCEALAEWNFFLQSAPFINKQIKIYIPNESFYWNAFYNFPGVLFYHSIYLAHSLMKPSKVSINGPGIYWEDKLRREFPNIPHVWSMYCTSINEVQMIDTW